jgi:nicotinamidase-related amidase/alkylated DNA repair dioxygenase AlkB
MSSLLDALTQNQPQFETRQALLVFDLQNEFVSPHGKLPVSTDRDFVERIKKIVPKFRELAGDVIWIRSEFKEKRIVNDGTEEGDVVMIDSGEHSNEITALPVPTSTSGKNKSGKSGRKSGRSRKKAMEMFKKVSKKTVPHEDPEQALPIDDELFLSNPSNGPCCSPGSTGADFPEAIKSILDHERDIMIVKSHYSVFKESEFVTRLRVELITELFICGCMTNLSVYATALDAARYGLVINLIDDCLSYRIKSRHDAAMKTMIEIMGARTITSDAISEDLDAPPDEPNIQAVATGLEDELGKMSIGGASKSKGGNSRQRDVDDITKALASSSLNGETSKVPSAVGGGEESTPNTNPNKRTQQIRRGIRTTAPQTNMKQSDPKSSIRMRAKPDKSKSTELSTEAKGKQGQSSAVPPVPSLPNGYSKSAAPSSHTVVETEENNAEPPAKSHTATKSVDPDKELNAYNNQSEVSSPKSKGKSGKSRLSSIQSSPSLRSTWPSGVVAALRKSPKPQLAEGKQETALSSPANSTPPTTMSKKKMLNLSNLPTRGPGESIGEGDSYIKHSFLSDSLRDPINDAIPLHSNIFHALYHEVRWQKMYHAGGEVPRLVSIQGTVDPKNGSKPIYRHPSDQSPPLLPWTHSVDVVRKEAEKAVGHELNHCLIQLYRTGEDNISEHSDKTLDIVHGSSIVNVSFGAQRTMRLRTKKGYFPANTVASKGAEDSKNGNDNNKETMSHSTTTIEDGQRVTQRIPMPHNSIFILGMKTNARWLHGIQADKRAAAERSDAEKAYNGMRISLTFRHIGTFLSRDESEIWGQGAKSKSKELPGEVVSGNKEKTDKMIAAFGKENHQWEFDWKGVYGDGFDVLHFTRN